MKINSFRNENYFLSNFYEIPVEYDGITYRNNEAAFQAQKCSSYEDKMVFSDLSASEAKRVGRAMVLRKDWESVKVRIMKEIVEAKFSQNADLAKLLVSTGDAYLEEGNDWGDRIWGTVNGEGRNLLGSILMEVREKIKTNTTFLETKGEKDMAKTSINTIGANSARAIYDHAKEVEKSISQGMGRDAIAEEFKSMANEAVAQAAIREAMEGEVERFMEESDCEPEEVMPGFYTTVLQNAGEAFQWIKDDEPLEGEAAILMDKILEIGRDSLNIKE